MFGYQGHPEWRDMSDYVVHFTKATDPGRTAYENLGSILASGVIEARTDFGMMRSREALGASQRCACFSEIPLDRLDRLIQRRSFYGVGFTRALVRSQGGAPVWYLEKDSPVAKAAYRDKEKHASSGFDPDHPFWRLTPFIDMPGSYGDAPYEFEWEREWRVAGDLRFAPSDVIFLFLPEEQHDRVRRFYVETARAGSGPVYDSPLIDPRWGVKQIQDAF